MKLTKRQLRSFNDNGYLKLPQILPDSLIDSACGEAGRLVSESIDPKIMTGPPVTNIFTGERYLLSQHKNKQSLHMNHLYGYSDFFSKFIRNRTILDTVGSIIGNSIRVIDDQLFLKQARTGGVTHWHRDSDYFGTLNLITFWLALDDADESNGCLMIIPGSHRDPGSKTGITQSAAFPKVYSGDNPLEIHYSIDSDAVTMTPIVLKKGEAVLIHKNVLHASFENTSERHRRSYVIEYFNSGYCLNVYKSKKYSNVFGTEGVVQYRGYTPILRGVDLTEISQSIQKITGLFQ